MSENMEFELNSTIEEIMTSLARLAFAADVYAAEQTNCDDPRVGLVQPVSKADAEELNGALRQAFTILAANPLPSEGKMR